MIFWKIQKFENDTIHLGRLRTVLGRKGSAHYRINSGKSRIKWEKAHGFWAGQLGLAQRPGGLRRGMVQAGPGARRAGASGQAGLRPSSRRGAAQRLARAARRGAGTRTARR